MGKVTLTEAAKRRRQYTRARMAIRCALEDGYQAAEIAAWSLEQWQARRFVGVVVAPVARHLARFAIGLERWPTSDPWIGGPDLDPWK